MSILGRDPYSRILSEYDDGTIRVCFRVSKEIYENLVDIIDFLQLPSVDDGFKLAVEALQEKVFGKKVFLKLKKIRTKPRKKAISEKEIREIRDMVSFLTKLINNISENLSKVERIGSLISTTTQTPMALTSRQPTKHHDINIDLGELRVKAENTAPIKEPEKSLEDAIEDVLVVAIAEDVLKNDKKEND